VRTGIANLPLHYGTAPAWLFEKMKHLAREISMILVLEFGPAEFLKKLSDPFWFQSFGCVLGFDWHSSGLTTTVCAALKEGLRGLEKDLGIFVCGGKGKTSRKTPEEITQIADRYSLNGNRLVYASKMSAKVDNSALQDGYQLYHHTFIFDKNGRWAVIQQGMNDRNSFARRYHWLDLKSDKDFVREPHTGIAAEHQEKNVLNMVAYESEKARKISTQIANEKPEKNIRHIKRIQELSMPRSHEIGKIKENNLEKVLRKTYERKPKNFESLLSIEGVGPKTIRALSLIAELIYKAEPSYKDPARFSFAHGGKDGVPYPIDKFGYEKSIEVLKRVVNQAKIGEREKINAFRRLASQNLINQV